MRNRTTLRRKLLLLSLFLIGACLAGTVVLYSQNRNRPRASLQPDRLEARDAALVAEFFQLREALGETVWPGWAQSAAPVLVYNEAYVFLIGYEAPPPGWARPPGLAPEGRAWSPVALTVGDQPVFRQPLPAAGPTPGAFTVRVGTRWVASMTTREWMGIAFASQFDEMVPAPLQPVFPYVPLTDLFLNSSDFYIAALAHESFHAYVGQTAPDRLLAAEASLHADATYPWADPTSRAAWSRELNLLTDALRAESDEAAVAAARAFLDQRAERRREVALTDAQIIFEKEREWSEGLAKYVELALWGAAAAASDYQPLAALSDDPDFDGYARFDQRWSGEVSQIGRSDLQAGEGRFYYTGMAQAFLLDRFQPGWQSGALAPGVYLEDLLATALTAWEPE